MSLSSFWGNYFLSLKSRKQKSKCWQITGSWHSDRELSRSPGCSVSFQELLHWFNCFFPPPPLKSFTALAKFNLTIHCDMSGNSWYHKQEFWHKYCLQCLRNFSQMKIFCTLYPATILPCSLPHCVGTEVFSFLFWTLAWATPAAGHRQYKLQTWQSHFTDLNHLLSPVLILFELH